MRIKITPDTIFVILLILSVLLHIYYPISIIIKYPANIFGFFIIGIGITIVSISNSVLIKNHTSIKPFEDPDVLITSGLFNYSRNPIYLGIFFILLGLEIFLGSLITFLFPIVLVIFLNQIIKNEEKRLEILFGDNYIKYKKEVRRWF